MSSVRPPQDAELPGRRSICARNEADPCRAASSGPSRPLDHLTGRAQRKQRAEAVERRAAVLLSLLSHLTPPRLPVSQSGSSSDPG